MEHDCSYTEACSKLQHLPPLICRVRHSQCNSPWLAMRGKKKSGPRTKLLASKISLVPLVELEFILLTDMTSNWGSKFPPSSCVGQAFVCRMLPVRLGAASATRGRLKLSGAEEVVQHSSTAGILGHRLLLQTCPTKSAVPKSFLPFLGSKLREQAHTLSINSSNLMPLSCRVH